MLDENEIWEENTDWDTTPENLDILKKAPSSDQVGIDLNLLDIELKGPKAIVKSFIEYTNSYKNYGDSGRYSSQQLNNNIIGDTIREVHKKYGGFNYYTERIIINVSRDLSCKVKQCKLGIIKDDLLQRRCKCLRIEICKKNKPQGKSRLKRQD